MSERQQAQRQQHKRRRKSSPNVTDDNETTTDVSNDNDNDDGNANNAISDPLPPGIDLSQCIECFFDYIDDIEALTLFCFVS
jgi:hypothetical protein